MGNGEGGWVIEDYYHFRGKKYTETTRPLEATTDENGRLNARFTIPEDYGGVHEVFVRDGDTTLAQGGIEVAPDLRDVLPRKGPSARQSSSVKGLGWRTMESTWVVNWDNHQVGYVSAAGTVAPRSRDSAQRNRSASSWSTC